MTKKTHQDAEKDYLKGGWRRSYNKCKVHSYSAGKRMKIKYLRKKGRKMRGQYKACENLGLWFFSKTRNEWILHYGENTIDRFPCRSIRAFKRRIKQWRRYLPKGVSFVLIGNQRMFGEHRAKITT